MKNGMDEYLLNTLKTKMKVNERNEKDSLKHETRKQQ